MSLDLILLSCRRQVDVPIHILGGESALITFQGVGYDLNTIGDTATSSEVLPPTVFAGSTKLTVPGQVSPCMLILIIWLVQKCVRETEIWYWPHVAIACVAGELP